MTPTQQLEQFDDKDAVAFQCLHTTPANASAMRENLRSLQREIMQDDIWQMRADASIDMLELTERKRHSCMP